ncbi:MAG TPA: phosphatidate cytidylyltransferase, partial [Dehalococcoidia bacterium]|nr:phosphatidate cytidylyltransferase [Dehalococcoidia bacterium]
MLKQRIITAVIGIPLLILLIWFGDPWFSLLIAVVVLISTLEFYHMVAEFDKRCPLTYFGLLWALALALSPHLKSTNMLPMVMVAAVVISLVCLLFHSPRERAFHDWSWMVAGVLYIGWMLSYWVNLGILEDGRDWIYLAMFAIFANDTGA